MSSWISWARGEKGGEDASSSENTKSGGWLELGSSSPMRMASKKGGSFKDPAKEGDAEEFSLSDEIEVWSEVVDKRLLHGKHDMK